MHISWRWLVPAGLAAVVAAAPGIGSISSAGADAPLPPRAAAQLLADLQAPPAHFSGTVSATLRLGLPALPQTGGSGASSLTGLLSGTHTLRVWYAGPQQVRVAVVASLSEIDAIRNGRDAWLWDSSRRSVTHLLLAADAVPPVAPGGATELTPLGLARRVLQAVGSTTAVTVGSAEQVAGRSAYELRVVPRSPDSLVAAVTLAVDSRSHLPLRVRVYATTRGTPAVDVHFTALHLGTPSAGLFAFSPPPGAQVHTLPAGPHPDAGSGAGPPLLPMPSPGAPQVPAAGPAVAAPQVIGSGWTTIVVADGAGAVLADGTAAAFLRGATRVSGAFGSGRLVQTPLVTVLITDDGRVFAGSVTPRFLLHAAGARASGGAGR